MTFFVPAWLQPKWLRKSRESLASSDWKLVAAALDQSAELRALTAAEMVARARRLTEIDRWGVGQFQLALSLFSEVVRRTKGFLPHSEQLVAAFILARGRIVEMATGEGKTITSAGAAVLVALQRRQVHLLTQNSYLAARDCETLRPLYEQLGLTASVLREDDSPAARRQAYRAQIVHGAGPEFGFDYLRQENTRRRNQEQKLGACSVQLLNGTAEAGAVSIKYDFAVVDEIDSVLIDEAALPLVLSEPVANGDDSAAVRLAGRTAERLQPQTDYILPANERRVVLTRAGEERVRQDRPAAVKLLQPWQSYVLKALQACQVLRRDVDYVVNNGKVAIVDQNTGRLFTDRTWQEGLHQAVEEKEGLKLSPQRLPVARVMRHSLMKLYGGMCGLSGTLTGVESEFESRFGLRTVTIPRHRPGRRQDLPDRFFANAEAKLTAAAVEIEAVHREGRPILVGTQTIASSHELSRRLKAKGLPHHLLNGVQDEQEAEVVSCAGRRGAITIATNIAGRGTDIRVDADLDAAGGMHVLGLERSESRRVDLQLAGRTARQGAAGSSRFYVAADDLLIAKYGGSLSRRMSHAADADGEAPNAFAAEVNAAQQRAEAAARRLRDGLLAAR